jgi:hypothetical protein
MSKPRRKRPDGKSRTQDAGGLRSGLAAVGQVLVANLGQLAPGGDLEEGAGASLRWGMTAYADILVGE